MLGAGAVHAQGLEQAQPPQKDALSHFADILVKELEERNITTDQSLMKDDDTLVIPPEVLDEAMLYGVACQNDNTLNSYYSCDCLSVKFLDKRLEAGPEPSRKTIADAIQGECKDGTNLAGMQFQYCMTQGIPIPVMGDYEKFCACMGNEYAKLYENHQGKVGSRQHMSFRTASILNCQSRNMRGQ
ncbi:MAG: hypothetical protein AAF182_00820 [Pseudomonadota bacterium]